MKKLLGILVLGLFWCNTSFAEELLIKCVGKYTDEFLIDTSKKTWGNAVADRSTDRKDIFISEQIFLRVTYMKGDEAWVCTSSGCGVGYDEINRLTGDYKSITLKIPRDELNKEWFDKKPIYESKQKFYTRARKYLSEKAFGGASLSPYVTTEYRAKCSKADKKF